MPTIAAWCTTASTPDSAPSTAFRSRTSATVSGAAPTIDGRGLRCAAGWPTSMTVTSWPAATSAEVTCEPMKPAPPVTRTRTSMTVERRRGDDPYPRRRVISS